jgi:hypothetical protein
VLLQHNWYGVMQPQPQQCSTSRPLCPSQIDEKAVQTPFEGNARVLLSFPEVRKGTINGRACCAFCDMDQSRCLQLCIQDSGPLDTPVE